MLIWLLRVLVWNNRFARGRPTPVTDAWVGRYELAHSFAEEK